MRGGRVGWLDFRTLPYDHLAGKSNLPKDTPLTAQELIRRDLNLKPYGLQAFSSLLMARWMTTYWAQTKPSNRARIAGLRPLLRSAQDPNKATQKYAIHRTDKLIAAYGGKSTTALALAYKVAHVIH